MPNKSAWEADKPTPAKVIMGLLLLVLIVIAVPAATILSLNILFGLSILLTVKTWVAAFWLLLLFLLLAQ